MLGDQSEAGTPPGDLPDNTARADAATPPPSAPKASPPGASIVDEVATLIDDARNYGEAELSFQKTRAKLAAISVGKAVIFAILALVLLNIAIIALAVGIVIALAPLVTIWGAIAIVVGALFVMVGALCYGANQQRLMLSEMFSGKDDEAEEAAEAPAQMGANEPAGGAY